ncbi:MAG TPA: DHA2 family efflux MFS transporter permease subunit [Verrucomicrobiae bacterium]|jgi:DHA2 family multidrug resistance protein|nr:DHA2 family efflux MFS transporter permease subunit [Verrucomicrobiae bacterium]
MNNGAPLKINPWMIAIAVILPTFIEVLDTTVVSVALPTVAGNLSATVSQATWIQTGYLISNAIILPASAWFSIVFGRKRLLLACIAIFTLASIACGAAPNLNFLIIASLVQGAGGGGLQPISQAILLESFPPAKRGQAMAVYVLGVVLAPVLGPVLGGWLTENYSWRWIYYINVPVGAMALWLVQRFIFDPQYIGKMKATRLDTLGFGLLSLWLGTMQTVLNKGQDEDWFNSEFICWFSLISVVAFIAFLVRELRTRNPLAELRIFTNRNFLVSNLLISVVFFLMYGFMTLQPLLNQNLMGYTAYASGLAQASRGLGMMLLTPLVGALVGKVSSRILIGSGLLLMTISALMMGQFNLDIAESDFFWPNVFQGMGMALSMVPLVTVATATIRTEQLGNATGLFALVRNLAGSIGIAVAVAMVTRGALRHQANLVTHLTPYDLTYQNAVQTAQTALIPSMGTTQAEPGALSIIYQSLLQQSKMLAYADEFRWLAIVCLISVPLVLFLKRVSPKGPVAVR